MTKKSSQWSCQCSSRSQYYLYKGHITFKLWTLSFRHYLTTQFWEWWLWYVECSYQTLFTHWPSCVCTVWLHHMNTSTRTVTPCMILKKKHSLPTSITLKSLKNLTFFDIPSGHPNMCTDTLPTNSHKHNFWFVANLNTKIHYAFSCWIVAMTMASILAAFEQNL